MTFSFWLKCLCMAAPGRLCTVGIAATHVALQLRRCVSASQGMSTSRQTGLLRHPEPPGAPQKGPGGVRRSPATSPPGRSPPWKGHQGDVIGTGAGVPAESGCHIVAWGFLSCVGGSVARNGVWGVPPSVSRLSYHTPLLPAPEMDTHAHTQTTHTHTHTGKNNHQKC